MPVPRAMNLMFILGTKRAKPAFDFHDGSQYFYCVVRFSPRGSCAHTPCDLSQVSANHGQLAHQLRVEFRGDGYIRSTRAHAKWDCLVGREHRPSMVTHSAAQFVSFFTNSIQKAFWQTYGQRQQQVRLWVGSHGGISPVMVGFKGWSARSLGARKRDSSRLLLHRRFT